MAESEYSTLLSRSERRHYLVRAALAERKATLNLGKQERRGAAGLALGDFGRWALCDNQAAFVASTGADVDYPITAAGDLHVVLNQNDRVACIDQPIELGHQPRHICRVQPSCGFVQHVERVATLCTL